MWGKVSLTSRTMALNFETVLVSKSRTIKEKVVVKLLP